MWRVTSEEHAILVSGVEFQKNVKIRRNIMVAVENTLIS
jgi:hypothetical protein